jgi:hypothetical protein
MWLAYGLTLAYPFQTTGVGGVAVSRQNWCVNCTNRVAARQQSQKGRKFMATKKPKKAVKKLKKAKKLKATKPLVPVIRIT